MFLGHRRIRLFYTCRTVSSVYFRVRAPVALCRFVWNEAYMVLLIFLLSQQSHVTVKAEMRMSSLDASMFPSFFFLLKQLLHGFLTFPPRSSKCKNVSWSYFYVTDIHWNEVPCRWMQYFLLNKDDFLYALPCWVFKNVKSTLNKQHKHIIWLDIKSLVLHLR